LFIKAVKNPQLLIIHPEIGPLCSEISARHMIEQQRKQAFSEISEK
jgi:hypothetical protein